MELHSTSSEMMDGAVKSNITEQTLAEQLKITEREIEERKQLIGFSSADVTALLQWKPIVQRDIELIVDEFYRRQRSISEVALLIGDAETFRRLHHSMRRYVLELFDGFYDSEYVNKRLRIGKVHKQIGVSPKLYIAAIVTLQEVLRQHLEAVVQNEPQQHEPPPLQSLHRLMMFDVQFVFDTYIHSLVSEVESIRHRVENYASSLETTIAERTRELERLSQTDPLTGLQNQRSYYEHLRREVARAERQGALLSLLYIDLNQFKELNDQAGHRAGDELLVLFSQALQNVSRVSDIACRYGGDEFVMILPETGPEQAEKVAQRLIQLFSQGDTQGITLSIGIAHTSPDNLLDPENLTHLADKAMYSAKQHSRVRLDNYIHQLERDRAEDGAEAATEVRTPQDRESES
ncbi:GGDEF domain-containing protein [Marinobacterium sedimentorum]|uniref:GGDEF domain-containing protein n=1 Tax=Marinobacterium sedimentorum TaxID=2927804 RepID=UPI0020C63FEE|nr:GGDEF domain-containing protein [Marinobacterium sedimentorum]MCP8686289.1 GGDEF domain-containing protein [Marinobacterium sedimentorum]